MQLNMHFGHIAGLGYVLAIKAYTVKTLYNAFHYNAGFSIARRTSSPKVETHSL